MTGRVGRAARYRWLVDIAGSPADDGVLYAIPHAGAGAAAVKKVCRALGDTLHTVAIRLPGRESRMDEEPLTDLTVLVDTLAGQIEDHAHGRDVLLYGHCSGAVIAYEVAGRLTTTRVKHLVVSAYRAPDRLPVRHAWRLPRAEFFALVAGDGYLPADVLDQPELLDLVEPALRADYEAIECHHHTPVALDVPILALLGSEDHTVPVDDIAAWSYLTRAGFRLERLPGAHNLLQEAPDAVAGAIRTVRPAPAQRTGGS